MIKNLFNFNYEFSLIENLWLNHFIDFCFLLSFEPDHVILGLGGARSVPSPGMSDSDLWCVLRHL